MESSLQQVGMTPIEARIYVALLREGSCTAGVLLRATKLHRNTLYQNLDRLIEKGLVSYVLIKNTKHFEATSIEELERLVLAEKTAVEAKEKTLHSVKPLIERLRTLPERKQEVTVFKGKKGLKTILSELAQEVASFDVLGTGWGMRDTLGPYYSLWHSMLKKRRVNCRILLPANKKGSFLPPFKARYVGGRHVLPATIAIAGPLVLTVTWGEEPIAVLVRSQKAAKGYQHYFELLWRQAKHQ